MKALVKYFLCLAIAMQCHCLMAQETVRFNSIPTVTAIIKIKSQAVDFKVVGFGKKSHGIVSLDTGADITVRIEVGDYNFDGELDFSIWYLDEGKGVYTIHRVFIFSKKNVTFMELFSDCGGEFINLKVDRKRRRLIST
ncbi:XAC2610-related protein [Cupriavidus necator]